LLKSKLSKRTLVKTICLVLLVLPTVSASPLEVDTTFWKPLLDSNIKTGGANASDFSLRNDLGMDNKAYTNLAVKWNADQNRWKASYMQATYNGSTSNLTTPINFQGTSYDVSLVNVTSVLGYKMFELSVDKPLKEPGLSLVYDVKLINFKLALDGGTATTKTEKNVNVPIPEVGVAYDSQVNQHMNYYGKVVGLPLFSKGYIYDVDFGVAIHPDKNYTMQLGYRDVALKGKNNTDYVKFGLKGIYMGATASF